MGKPRRTGDRIGQRADEHGDDDGTEDEDGKIDKRPQDQQEDDDRRRCHDAPEHEQKSLALGLVHLIFLHAPSEQRPGCADVPAMRFPGPDLTAVNTNAQNSTSIIETDDAPGR
jgi:hypothetical protein